MYNKDKLESPWHRKLLRCIDHETVWQKGQYKLVKTNKNYQVFIQTYMHWLSFLP